jgi:hypothetical protein
MNHHPDAPRIKLTESTDARNGRLSDPRAKRTKENTAMNTETQSQQIAARMLHTAQHGAENARAEALCALALALCALALTIILFSF